MNKIHNENEMSFVPVAGLQQLILTHVKKTLNARILSCKTSMTIENFYYKILPKAKLITSRYVEPLLYSSWLQVIYFL